MHTEEEVHQVVMLAVVGQENQTVVDYGVEEMRLVLSDEVHLQDDTVVVVHLLKIVGAAERGKEKLNQLDILEEMNVM